MIQSGLSEESCKTAQPATGCQRSRKDEHFAGNKRNIT
jgi:hypothetical protein